MIDSTGPKISSWAIVMSLVTSENTVGLHVVALVEALGLLGATGEQRGALVDALLDVVAHAVDCCAADTSGPSLRLAAERVADGEAFGRRRPRSARLRRACCGARACG